MLGIASPPQCWRALAVALLLAAVAVPVGAETEVRGRGYSRGDRRHGGVEVIIVPSRRGYPVRRYPYVERSRYRYPARSHVPVRIRVGHPRYRDRYDRYDRYDRRFDDRHDRYGRVRKHPNHPYRVGPGRTYRW